MTTLFKVDGVLALDEMSQLAKPRPAGSRIRALYSALSRSHPRPWRRLLRRDPAEGSHRPSSLRVIRRRRAISCIRRRAIRTWSRSNRRSIAPRPIHRSSRRWPRPPRPANRSLRWSSSRRASTRRPISAGRAISNAPACRSSTASSNSRRMRSCRWWFGARAVRWLRTCHVGTGNYHPVTARIYTDLSYFTADPVDRPRRRPRVQLRDRLRRAGRARTHGGLAADFAQADCRSHRPGDRPRQSRPSGGDLDEDEFAGRSRHHRRAVSRVEAGVAIELVVRGICCLRPGVPGLSENIRVKSIVGRFLEHGRIYCFGAGHVLPHAKGRRSISPPPI